MGQDVNKQILFSAISIMKGLHSLDRQGGQSEEMSVFQLRFLSLVRNLQPLKMTKFAKMMNVRPATLTPQVDKFISMGLIERINDKDDRRIVLIQLTKKGETMRQKLFEKKMAQFEKVMGSFTKVEKDSLAKLMQKLDTTVSAQLSEIKN